MKEKKRHSRPRARLAKEHTPAAVLSDYGVWLGEEAIPFVPAVELVANLQGEVDLTEVTLIAAALYRSLYGSTESTEAGAWSLTARREALRTL